MLFNFNRADLDVFRADLAAVPWNLTILVTGGSVEETSYSLLLLTLFRKLSGSNLK